MKSLGFAALDWIEAHLCHGPGDVQGQPIVLDDELAVFIVKAYELNPDGRRRYTEEFLSRPKARAKSGTAAMLVCFEGLGPARFDHWAAAGEISSWGYEYEKGEPVGRPVTAPFIRCLATEESQAGATYDHVRAMLLHMRENFGVAGLDVGLTRTLLPDGGEIRPSTASSASKDGGRETFTVVDEAHLYTTTELRRMWEVVRRNSAKRKTAEPHMLYTSTMYRPGEDSVAEIVHSAWQQGKTKRLLFDHVEAPPCSLGNRKDLMAALKAVYGPAAEWLDLERIADEIQDPRTSESDARRYWLNQAVVASDAWIDPAVWKERTADVVVADGDAIAVGFDGSIREDATAVVACRLEDGHVFPLAVWEKPDLAPDWEVPINEVDAVIARAFQRYTVERMYADPARWQDVVGRWAAEFGQEIVHEWWTNRERAMVSALERFHTAAVTGQLTHDGDAVLARHVANARVKPVRSGDLIRKEHHKSAKKIDAAMAAVLAYEARADAIAAGAGKKRRRRKAGGAVGW